MGVNLNYKLTGRGWAECLAEINGESIELSASYLSDALRSLLSATMLIVEGRDTAVAEFQDEPGQYRWVLHREQDGDRLLVRILWFDDEFSQKPDGEGQVLFAQNCRIRTFVGAVYSMCERLLAEHGMAGYKQAWVNHSFPVDLYEKLARIIKARRQGSAPYS